MTRMQKLSDTPTNKTHVSKGPGTHLVLTGHIHLVTEKLGKMHDSHGCWASQESHACLLGKRHSRAGLHPRHCLPAHTLLRGRPEHSPSPCRHPHSPGGPSSLPGLCRRRRNEARESLQQAGPNGTQTSGRPSWKCPFLPGRRDHGRRDLPRTLKGPGVGQTCLTPS